MCNCPSTTFDHSSDRPTEWAYEDSNECKDDPTKHHATEYANNNSKNNTYCKYD